MGKFSGKGHNPDMSGAKEGKVSPWKNADQYVKSPADPLTPGRCRRQDYTPDTGTPDIKGNKGTKAPYAGGYGGSK